MKPLLALLLVTVLGLTACSDTEPGGPRPALPGPTATRAAPKADLVGIVDDPEARIVGVTVRRSDPSVRSVVWSLCRTPKCHRADEVIAVTADGFATRHLHALPQQTLETPLDGVYLLTDRRGAEILQPDGSRTPVGWQAGPPGPLVRAEKPVGIHRFGRVHAVDTTTGAGHLVPTPGEALGVHLDGSGALRIQVSDPRGVGARLLSSYDGGRTWDERSAFEPPAGRIMQSLDSSTTTAAVVTGGDGATLLPVGGLHRADGSGWRRIPGFEGPTAYLGEGGGAVLPDGRLLLSVASWSSGRRPAGLWLSDGRDWSDLRPVPMGPPFDSLDPRTAYPPVLDILAAPRKVTVYAVDDSRRGHTLWSSTDAGHTWTELAAR